MPASIRSLEAHLADGDPDSWRAGLRVLELAFGRAVEQPEEPSLPEDVLGIRDMSSQQRQAMLARLLNANPALSAKLGIGPRAVDPPELQTA